MESLHRPRKNTVHPDARAAILRAAERIFAEKGLEGARTDAIARSAGVNKALLYYYFRSKNALFQAVVENVLEESHRRLMAILSSEGAASGVLLRYVEALFDVLSRRPEYVPLIHRLILTEPKLVERLMRGYFVPRSRKLAAVIRRGVRDGEFRRVDSVQMAISIGALAVLYFSWGPVMKSFAPFDPFDTKHVSRRRREVVEFVRYGLFKHPEAR
ncbi:MAG: TetR/AcrR family transcriptional regulator [Terriglobia bacterium]